VTPAHLWPRVAVGAPDACWPWTGPHRNGYGYVNLTIDRRRVFLRAHRLAWTLTHGAIPDGADVLHRCDAPRCCNPEHLFLGNDATNAADRNRKGRQARGESNGRARLTDADVRAILAADAPPEALACRYGVSGNHVRAILAGKRWAHMNRTTAVNAPAAACVDGA